MTPNDQFKSNPLHNGLVAKPSAIIFDLDGTLLDDDNATQAALRVFHAVHGKALSMSAGELRVRWTELLRRYFALYLRGQLSMQEQRRDRMRDLFCERGCQLTTAEADAAFSVYECAYAQAWCVFPDVMQALSALRGFQLAILTNGQREQQLAKLRATRLADRFERIFISSEIGAAKPEPAAFRYASSQLGVRECECIFVGDDLEVDIRGAIGAGMPSVWLNRCREATPAGMTDSPCAIHSLLDLGRLIELSR